MKKKLKLADLDVKSYITSDIQGGHPLHPGTVYDVTDYELCVTYQAPCPTHDLLCNTEEGTCLRTD